MGLNGENNLCILPTLEGWVYTWAQYTPTLMIYFLRWKEEVHILL